MKKNYKMPNIEKEVGMNSGILKNKNNGLFSSFFISSELN